MEPSQNSTDNSRNSKSSGTDSDITALPPEARMTVPDGLTLAISIVLSAMWSHSSPLPSVQNNPMAIKGGRGVNPSCRNAKTLFFA